MTTMIVKHRVANFEAWKAVFDEMEPVRRAHGWTGHEVLRGDADGNLVVVVNHVKDLASAQKYGALPELRAAMARGGVEGPPEIVALSDVEAKRY